MPGRGYGVFDCGRARIAVMNLIGRCEDVYKRQADNNALIFVGNDVKFLSVASIVISATLGMASIASGLMGYLIRDMKAISRVALVIGGLLMVIPGTVTDLAGLAVLVAVLVLQRIENKKDKAAASV